MMVFGAFMPWVRDVLGTNLSWKAFYSTDLGHAHSFVESVGFVFIVLALLGIVGLAARTGGLGYSRAPSGSLASFYSRSRCSARAARTSKGSTPGSR